MNHPISAALMCHAPIVIPQIAGREAAAVAQSTRAMENAAKVVCDSNPELLVLVSPHTPRLRTDFLLASNDRLTGSFTDFGHSLALELPGAPATVRLLLDAAAQSPGIVASMLRTLDHGSLVPLYFLRQAGLRAQVLIIALPMEPHLEQCKRMGQWLANNLPNRWALVASGDMSYRLKPGAPAGYHQRASKFDSAVVKAVRAGQLDEAFGISEELRDLAAEDVLDSLAVAAGALGSAVLPAPEASYEGPFGVGYLVSALARNAA